MLSEKCTLLSLHGLINFDSHLSTQNPSTDYSQPPLSDAFPGVLNQGRRRYGHPALSGQLPEPWLPVLSETSQHAEVPEAVKEALVMDLRRRWSKVKRAARKGVSVVPGINIPDRPEPSSSSSRRSDDLEDPARMWRGSEPSPIENDLRGVLSDDDEELEEGSPGMTRFVVLAVFEALLLTLSRRQLRHVLASQGFAGAGRIPSRWRRGERNRRRVVSMQCFVALCYFPGGGLHRRVPSSCRQATRYEAPRSDNWRSRHAHFLVRVDPHTDVCAPYAKLTKSRRRIWSSSESPRGCWSVSGIWIWRKRKRSDIYGQVVLGCLLHMDLQLFVVIGHEGGMPSTSRQYIRAYLSHASCTARAGAPASRLFDLNLTRFPHQKRSFSSPTHRPAPQLATCPTRTRCCRTTSPPHRRSRCPTIMAIYRAPSPFRPGAINRRQYSSSSSFSSSKPRASAPPRTSSSTPTSFHSARPSLPIFRFARTT